MPSFKGNPHTQRHEILPRKTTVLGAAHGEDFVILACSVLIQIVSVTDRQTDRQMPRRWLTRAQKREGVEKTEIIVSVILLSSCSYHN